MLVFVIVIPC